MGVWGLLGGGGRFIFEYTAKAVCVDINTVGVVTYRPRYHLFFITTYGVKVTLISGLLVF